MTPPPGEPTPSFEAVIVPDPTGNPLDRLEVRVKPASGYSAHGLAGALASCSPPIMVRGHLAELGHFLLDPCNLHPGDAEIVADQLVRLPCAEPQGAAVRRTDLGA